MFDFLFKRPAPPTSTATARPMPSDNQAASVNLAKQEAISQADALSGDESAAAEFILQCQFADARLKAAKHIHSRAQLERVRQAMRNTDRRVSKLMQTKLDVLLQQEAQTQSANQCIEQAQRLLNEQQLAPNQVADLDRAWQSGQQVPHALQHQFDVVRSQLRGRLEAQAALQRAVIDVLANLNKLVIASELATLAESERSLALLERAMAQHAAAPEAASLPKHLFAEFTHKQLKFKQQLAALEQHAAAIAARQEALLRWEVAADDALKIDSIKREWKAFPALQNNAILAPLQARFDVILLTLAGAQKSTRVAAQEIKQDIQLHFTDLLNKLEHALQDGALQLASEADKSLRAIDAKLLRLSEAQSTQLVRVRAELSRLQGWAKWGGNVSREELLKAVDGLPAQSLGVLELAKKVGSLRERWKSLDISAGPANNELWYRFDAACTTAYAPAAEHFKKLADERRQNGEKARALIAEVTQFAVASNVNVSDAVADWKALAAFCGKLSQAWHKLGTIDRKDKKQLDTEFYNALQALSGPLAQQRAVEMTRREKLITEAAALNPNDRGALDNLRALQERWQVQAKSLPLEHKEEQALWQRFREACDLAFAKRKEIANAVDAERKQNLQAKDALCDALDAALVAEEKEIAKILRESKDAWIRIGPIPRAAEDKTEKRYKSAVQALQGKLDERRKAAIDAEFTATRDKLKLCYSIEQALASGTAMDVGTLQTFQNDWEKLPSLRGEFERKLQERFNLALNAAQAKDQQYMSVLNKNTALLANEVLRLEIVLGIASPAELAQQRLQLQVEVLKSSLKAGVKTVTLELLSSQLSNLCALPAVADQQMMGRLDQLMAHFKNTVA